MTTLHQSSQGTLTENRMTVVEGWLAGRLLTRPPQPTDLPAELKTSMVENMVRNNKAYITEEPSGSMTFTGNRTECSLLLLTRSWGIDFRTVREEMDDRLHQVGEEDVGGGRQF